MSIPLLNTSVSFFSAAQPTDQGEESVLLLLLLVVVVGRPFSNVPCTVF